MEDLTDDGFLDSRLRVLQPRHGYRAAVDPVLLAASVRAVPGDKVFEPGCGAGVASLCLGHRVRGLSLTGAELQPFYAGLAMRNSERNAIAFSVIPADIAALPDALRSQTFDHVIVNPPYFVPGGGTPAKDAGRETALREATPLALWMDVALRRLRPGGWLTMINEAARLPEMLGLIDGRAGDAAVLPVCAREGRPARRVILRARKGSRGVFTLAPPLILHTGTSHIADGDDMTARARAVLRDGAPLEF